MHNSQRSCMPIILKNPSHKQCATSGQPSSLAACPEFSLAVARVHRAWLDACSTNPTRRRAGLAFWQDRATVALFGQLLDHEQDMLEYATRVCEDLAALDKHPLQLSLF